MKLAFYLPMYQIHRLYQLVSDKHLKSVTSLRQYRDSIRKVTTLHDSFKATQEIMKKMSSTEEQIVIPPPVNLSWRISNRLTHPIEIRQEGVIDVTNWSAPTTNTTPQRYISRFYNESNCSDPVYQRKRTCPGNIWIPIGGKGSKHDNKRCSRCGCKARLVYCTICHHYYCLDYNIMN